MGADVTEIATPESPEFGAACAVAFDDAPAEFHAAARWARRALEREPAARIGIIVPDLHYGRDALIGIALFLTHLAQSKKSIKQLRNTYPDYFISKNKIDLGKSVNVQDIFDRIQKKYKNNPSNTDDGLKIEFENDWVHLRTSNTEPIIRIYSESNFETTAQNIARKLMKDISEVM